MKRHVIFLLTFFCSVFCYSQETGNPLVDKIQLIKTQHGDSIARLYLESKKDSLEQKGEMPSYLLLWGVLTSNMWNEKPTESLRHEYKEYLESIISGEIKSDDYTPTFELLSPLWQLTYDYYNMLYNEGDKETALSLLLNIHRWFKPYEEARKSKGYAQSLLDLCVILIRDMHKYKEGDPYCKEYNKIAPLVYGDNSAEYALSIYLLTLTTQEQADETANKLKKAIDIYEKAGVPDSAFLNKMKQNYDLIIAAKTRNFDHLEKPDSASSYSVEDCISLVILGKSDLAKEKLLQIKGNLWNEEYVDTIKCATVSIYLTKAFLDLGDIPSAQKEIEDFNKVIGISLDKLPITYVQIFYANAGIVAFHLRDYFKALRYSQAACKLYEKSGDFGLDYSYVLSNIAMIYAEAGDALSDNYYLDAKWYIDEAVSVFEEHVGSLTSSGNKGIALLNNKARVYSQIGDIDDAIDVLQDVVRQFSGVDEVREFWEYAVHNLADFYMQQERWEEAANMLAINSKNSQTDYMLCLKRSICNMQLQDVTKTLDDQNKLNTSAMKNISNVFSYFAGVEREKYWTQLSQQLISINNLIANQTKAPNAISNAYNNTLLCKNLLLNSSRLLDDYLNRIADTSLRYKYSLYKANKEKISYKSENQAVRDSLSRTITELEKSIIGSIDNFGELLLKESKSWHDIQRLLNDDEIAIEYCDVPHLGKYPNMQFYYGAYVLRKDFECPVLIPLENANNVENIFDNNDSDELFINELYSSEKATLLYKILWNKLTPYLQGIKTVYYSPTGKLVNVNFDVLSGEDKIMLSDKFRMIRVSSTASLDKIKDSGSDNYQTSVLYGNIKYDESTSDMIEASSVYSTFSGMEITPQLALRSVDVRGRWGAIPSTKIEIENISKLLMSKGIKVSQFEENAANEESFKSISGKSPDILHLATHGFAFDTPQRAESNKFISSTSVYSEKDAYMMWSGLILAGGNNVWQGRFDLKDVEDGILTADEISRMDLSNTKLVVLSACETAKGKIDSVDGVYGLQRAFKMAGAETIVMSLWKVQDDATSLLMTQFYDYLTKGNEKRQALWKAMMDVREKYEDPYYWAGFIMLD